MHSQLLHLLLVLPGREEESDHSNEDHEYAKDTCSEWLLRMFDGIVLVQVVEGLVEGEAEGDEGGSSTNPGHHGAFMGEIGTLESELKLVGSLSICCISHERYSSYSPSGKRGMEDPRFFLFRR